MHNYLKNNSFDIFPDFYQKKCRNFMYVETFCMYGTYTYSIYEYNMNTVCVILVELVYNLDTFPIN